MTKNVSIVWRRVITKNDGATYIHKNSHAFILPRTLSLKVPNLKFLSCFILEKISEKRNIAKFTEIVFPGEKCVFFNKIPFAKFVSSIEYERTHICIQIWSMFCGVCGKET